MLVLLIAGGVDARHPLEPLDTSSPRATINSFLYITEEVSRRYFEYRNSPSPATMQAIFQLRERYQRVLDLSQVAPTARAEVSTETFHLLWEVIARLELPDLAEIPDATAFEQGDEAKPALWQIPHSAVTIARVEEGPRAGEFLFSADTVKRVRSFYKRARELPYLRPMPTENVYQDSQRFTGWMIPLAWVEALPEWTNTLFLDQVMWKWFAVALLFGLAIAAVIAVFLWARRGPWDGSVRSYLHRLSTPAFILVLAPILEHLTTFQINTSGAAAEVPDFLIEVSYSIAVVLLIWFTTSWIAEAIIASPRIRSESLGAHIGRLAARSIGVVASLVILFRLTHNLGIPVYGLVAGAGVSGLAIALAARGTLENFLGTLNLYADRPVRVGDFCRYGEDPSSGWLRIGNIEEIGLRSTRIRGIDRTITTIPNAEFCNMHIVNLTQRDRRLLMTTLQLRYETTPEQMRYVLAKLRELLLGHPMVTPEPARVRFVGYGAYSKNVGIFA